MARTRPKSALKPKSKTSQLKFTVPVPRTGLFAFLAAFAGIVAAVPLMFAVMMPMVRQDVASAVSAADKHVVSVAPADDTLACAQPSTSTAAVGGQGGGQVLGASTVAIPPVGGQGGGMGGGNSTTTTYVHKLVNGVFTASGSISNTGPGSSNNVTTNQTATTTVNNNNDIDVNNVNVQKSETGDANVSNNTTGGAATTGDASNTNSTNLNLSVSN